MYQFSEDNNNLLFSREILILGVVRGVHSSLFYLVFKVRAADNWLCYMCCPIYNNVGLLIKRKDWLVQLRQFFQNDHNFEFVSVVINRKVSNVLLIFILASILHSSDLA